ncbi:MAG TPA: zinc ribbon domain-containing protein [Kofleriaceae bacterium]|nr:zinc ribbon domain-containing protein [Kofleriaceae bacterium]
MPIYEYRCKKCGKTFEYMQRISEGPKRKCEACGQLALEKLISQTSFQLKGAGWYKDLYSSPKPGSNRGGDGAASGGDSSSTSKGGGESSGAAASATSSSGSESKKGKKAKA